MDKQISITSITDQQIAEGVKKWSKDSFVINKYPTFYLDAALDEFYQSLDSGLPMLRNERYSDIKIKVGEEINVIYNLLFRNLKRIIARSNLTHEDGKRENRMYIHGYHEHAYDINPKADSMDTLYTRDKDDGGPSDVLNAKLSHYIFDFLTDKECVETMDENQVLDHFFPEGSIDTELREFLRMRLNGTSKSLAAGQLGRHPSYYGDEFTRRLKTYPVVERLAKEYGYTDENTDGQISQAARKRVKAKPPKRAGQPIETFLF